MTITPTLGGFAGDPDYAAGRADAYDDSRTLTLDQLHARTAHYIQHATLARATGYADRVLELRMETAAVTAAETELAHTGLTTWARTNGGAA
jgi:hypothetical protein